MPLIVKDFTWEQTEKVLFITVPLKGVKASKIDIFSSEEYLKASAITVLLQNACQDVCTPSNGFQCWYLVYFNIELF